MAKHTMYVTTLCVKTINNIDNELVVTGNSIFHVISVAKTQLRDEFLGST